MRYKAVIIGAGALGLGFLAERMADDYDLCLVDTSARADLLRELDARQEFTVNICALEGVRAVKVSDSFETVLADDLDGYRRALQEADIVLTVTGRKVLDRVVDFIAPAMNDSPQKQWLLFCENGLDVAAAYTSRFNSSVVPTDTVMSRMCRFADPGESVYKPLWPGFDQALVVEDHNYLPLDADNAQDGPFTSRFDLVTHEQFLCWEYIKFYMHNGAHAFVSYHAHLEGAEFLSETSERIRELARRMMVEEIAPAIARNQSSMPESEIADYGLSLLERFYNPCFHDAVARGIRGADEKLAPNERLIGGCDYIRRAGIEPVIYSTTVDAARQIANTI